MNTKKYRVYLMGLIVAALVCGMFIYIANGKRNQIPVEGTLVEHSTEEPAYDENVVIDIRTRQEYRDGMEAWA